jgi:hypothetical protein
MKGMENGRSTVSLGKKLIFFCIIPVSKKAEVQ